ncbi:hypothetical protein Vadar_019164 [Vaccinium darrowii]|uniref:Uncharacterized protein n=1 Tax=Vaccinium darrowii TaxID=229202 RepID=A0ACB7YXP0_9ERIC|nr:hypothetical protein Vadar_019164 [Vaccinium darrowii]
MASSSPVSFLPPPNPLLPLTTPQPQLPFPLSSFSLLSPSSQSPPTLPPLTTTPLDLEPSQSSLPCDIFPVLCPSLDLANLVFCKDTFNVQVTDDDPDEPQDLLISRFNREVRRAGIIREVCRRRFFENKREEKKRKKREADMRNRRRRLPPKEPEPEKGVSNGEGYDEEDDNGNFEGVEVPYC